MLRVVAQLFRSLYAVTREFLAPSATASVLCWLVALPGGNPVTAVPGLNPRAPWMTVEPAFVIVLPARTAELVAVPKRGWVAANAAIGHKPTTNAETTIDSAITGRWILFIDLAAPLSPLWSEIRL